MAPDPGSDAQVSTVNPDQISPRKRLILASHEDEALKKDKGYRRFSATIKEILNSFDTKLQDWADYISFLNRLLKAINAHPSNVSILPSKGVIAQRLAQCLTPSLPNGVHQRALEVYLAIFKLIGKTDLARDLTLYFPGLSSTLSFASLSVKPVFLSIMESHILPLDPKALRPALKAIILSLLPGLEEETGEDFDRTIHLMDKFRLAALQKGLDHHGDEFFWQCFFLASLTSSSRSQGALAFLSRRLPQMSTPISRRASSVENDEDELVSDTTISSEIAAVTSPEPGLLVRSLANGLTNDQTLIQRGYLDILTTHVPLHSAMLQTLVKKDDLDLLVLSAVSIVLRRDTSLNRRLWTWLLGPEPSFRDEAESGPTSPTSPDTDGTLTPRGRQKSMRTDYFRQFGLPSLVRALRQTIDTDHRNSLEQAKPLRVCQSLMDRWEIGGLVIPEVFLIAMNSVRRYKRLSPSKEKFREVLRSANVFFDGVESRLIWGEITTLLLASLKSSHLSQADRSDNLNLVKFIVGNFNLKEEEMLEFHIPLAILASSASVLLLMEQNTAEREAKQIDWGLLTSLATEIILNLAELISEFDFDHATGSDTDDSGHEDRLNMEACDILSTISKFYNRRTGYSQKSRSPFASKAIIGLILKNVSALLNLTLINNKFDEEFASQCGLFTVILQRIGPDSKPVVVNLFPSLLSVLQQYLEKPLDIPHRTLCTIASISTTLYSHSLVTPGEFTQLLQLVVRHAWVHLSAQYPKYHVETVKVLWQLQACLPSDDRQIESIVSTLLVEELEATTSAEQLANPGQKIAVLWTHTLHQQSLILDNNGQAFSAGPKSESRSIKVSPSAKFEIMLSRPSFILLDALENESSNMFLYVRGWIQTLTSLEKLLWIIISGVFSTDLFHSTSVFHLINNRSAMAYYLKSSDDLASCRYYVRSLHNVLRWSHVNLSSINNRVLYRVPESDPEKPDHSENFRVVIVKICLRILHIRTKGNDSIEWNELRRTQQEALSILRLILSDEQAEPLTGMMLHYHLLDILSMSLDANTSFLQLSILECLFLALKLTVVQVEDDETEEPKENSAHKRNPSKDTANSSNHLGPAENIESKKPRTLFEPPSQLRLCLEKAFESESSKPVLDNWVNFLTEILPLYSETIFRVLIPFVECLCRQIQKYFGQLKQIFETAHEKHPSEDVSDASLISLMNGLEQVLAQGHDQLMIAESNDSSMRAPDQPQGFFGNMVSGVFSSESNQIRSATANDRLTVVLTFQDALRVSYEIWSWGSSNINYSHDVASVASFNYTSLRLRNRARRMLEHLFAAEPLECLEVIVGLWQVSCQSTEKKTTSVFDLLHVLAGSRPKHTIPAIFNSIYSRSNPNALDPLRKSTLTSDLQDVDVAAFLVEYAKTLEDDALDEIWSDCMAFVKDVLQNPFPHRQTLPCLLEFTAILGDKLDNTNFGDPRKMRKELSDIFMRLLTATFTTRPVGFATESMFETVQGDGQSIGAVSTKNSNLNKSQDIVSLLATILPLLSNVLSDSDRLTSAITAISTNVIAPTIKSKRFPKQCSSSFHELLLQLSKLSGAQKIWKKDVNDVFNDLRFFTITTSELTKYWLPLLRQWVVGDRERMLEILNRLTAPTTAGIMFGVGATSARLEADKKTQLNLKRIALLIMANADDTFTTNLQLIQNRITDLLGATSASSPSSVTRTEAFVLLRALILKTNQTHLAPLWPVISSELQAALSTALPGTNSQTYSSEAVLQACKLLDVLLILTPDEFQLHDWLFVTDTIDAVYRPPDFRPIALVDEISEELGTSSTPTIGHRSDSPTHHAELQTKRRPLLKPGSGRGVKEADIFGKVLRPFFSQLSIYAFESIYQAREVDREACVESILIDLCDDEG